MINEKMENENIGNESVLAFFESCESEFTIPKRGTVAWVNESEYGVLSDVARNVYEIRHENTHVYTITDDNRFYIVIKQFKDNMDFHMKNYIFIVLRKFGNEYRVRVFIDGTCDDGAQFSGYMSEKRMKSWVNKVKVNGLRFGYIVELVSFAMFHELFQF